MIDEIVEKIGFFPVLGIVVVALLVLVMLIGGIRGGK